MPAATQESYDLVVIGAGNLTSLLRLNYTLF
jgi:hypothetical protein